MADRFICSIERRGIVSEVCLRRVLGLTEQNCGIVQSSEMQKGRVNVRGLREDEMGSDEAG